ncbi:Cytosolic copper metallochaperone [Coemansia sp. RSA 1199]|nr:Cytosolic copper metallochaperone [Coemansia sp. RSA 1199]
MSKFEFNVVMSCGGCSKAVGKALEKAEVSNVDISLEKQTVVIEDSPALFSDEVKEAGLITDKEIYDFKYNKLLETIKKTGKKVVLPEEDKTAEAA